MIETETPRERPTAWVLLALIAVLVVVAYGGTFANGFVWDDETFIVRNPFIRDLSLWPQYFTRPGTVSADPDPTFLRLYRPVQTLSFAVDAALWGQRAGGFHLTSLLLHLATCYALLYAFGPLVGRRNAFLAALFFAVHPALSEGVLSLAARGNQLYTLFGLLSIGAFIRVARPFDRHHATAVVAALLSFFSKEPAIALIALLPLLQAAFGRPGRLRERSSVLLYLPFLLAAALYLGARMAVVETSSPVPYWGGSLGQTLLMQASVFMTYMRLLVWPFWLSGRYPVPYANPLAVVHATVTIGCIVLAAVLARRGGKGRLLSLAIAWFYLSLAPVANIIPIPGNMTGERFLYFSFAGVFPLLAGTMTVPTEARQLRNAAAGLACVLLAFVAMDMQRTRVWRSDAVFFSVLARQTPDDPLVQSLMAKEEVLAGRPESAVRRLAPVIGRTSTYRPEEKAALLYWYGRALLAAGWPQEAYRQFATVILLERSVPGDLVPFLVEAAARSGRLGEAHRVVEQALLRQPKDDVLWNSFGIVRGMEGDAAGAREAFERAVLLNPGNREAAENLMRARQMEGARGR